jgi:hypothetical protein
VRNKKRFSRIQADGHSTPLSEKHLSLDLRVSKSSVEEWTRKLLGGEAELSTQSHVSIIATVVKCRDQPLYVWVAVDACTTHLVRCFTHKHHGESAQ